ncbi:MAG: ribosome maturation factor RimM [Gammaproteobacteria bacterium]|nr:ribosome maturation factor RimM [Gammaproteobacteria bacterium]NNC98340.1 ribosome maturation factor RimM [Gammaproteobacteria bacterium]NNM14401.1 ribosome maturation factor RimM [Gammaproteobacteria bacterium]
MSHSTSDQALLLLGKVGGVFGLHGWLKILSYCEPKNNIFEYPIWYLQKPGSNSGTLDELEVSKGKAQGKGLIAKLDGVDDRCKAESLLGCNIYIHKNQLDNLDANDFYWHQLIGLQVKDQHNAELGQVDHLLATGANDVLVVKPCDTNAKNILIPYVWGQVIKTVDLESGTITVDWDMSYLTD